MISKEEILSIFYKPDLRTTGEFTANELGHMMGYARGGVNRPLYKMFHDGLIETVGVKLVPRIDGRNASVPVYRFTKAFHDKVKAAKRKKK